MPVVTGTNTQRAPGNAAETPVRIIDALIAHAEVNGIRRFTMDEIARAAGLARITIYSHFPNKKVLLQSAIGLEVERYFAALDEAIPHGADPETWVVETFTAGYHQMRRHRLLQRTLRSEADILLPLITGKGSLMVSMSTRWLASQLAEVVEGTPYAAIDLDETAEFSIRVMQSLLINPNSGFDLDGDGARRAASRWLLPMIREQLA